jgi:predicted secreted hydrolase
MGKAYWENLTDKIGVFLKLLKNRLSLSFLLFTVFLSTNGILEAEVHAEEGAYEAVTGPCNPQFPRDHGPHPGYHTEWWYYTGNLQAKGGERYGFQLTFFRSRPTPANAEKPQPEPNGSQYTSAWRTQQVYLAHAALTDIGSKRFLHKEQIAREALGLAGGYQEGNATTIFVKNWSARLGPSEHVLNAATEDFEFSLTLRPLKDPVLHGESGYSLKGTTPERASCYYSFSRLEARGALKIKGREIPVEGACWMDHEFSSAPLEPDLVGWDWFSLQLADNRELMIYLLRRKDGAYSPASSGTFVDASGKAVHLVREDFSVETLKYWTSPHSGGRYPSGWRIRVRWPELDLMVSPNLEDQEMRVQESTGITYWEGSVSVSSKKQVQSVEGVGYVELTGYAAPMDAPL